MHDESEKIAIFGKNVQQMKKLIVYLAAAALLISAASCSNDNPVLKVSGGRLRGVPSENGHVLVYKGVPYAAAPVGDLRFRAPQPVTPWEGVKTADTFGNICIQPGSAEGTFYWREFFWEGLPEQSEDCLYLNVWAPAGTVGKRGAALPVAMWIHGGAFVNGYGNEVEMDGEAWAERGVILVTINYRLGMLGFLSHPALSAENGGRSGNYGLMDQIAALRWIHDNIAQFGGDPANVTILGQSAGAMSVKHLCTSPEAKPYITRAIIQSGGGIGGASIAPETDAQARYDSLGKAILDLGGFADAEALRSAPAADLIACADKYNQLNNTWVRFAPHNDGVTLTEDFDTAVYASTVADIPYMIGCNAQDYAGLGGASVDRFSAVRDSLSDKPVFQYFFKRDLPGEHDDDFPQMDGAFHSSELWYMFGTQDRSWRPFTEADKALSARMLDAWTGFARNGNPGWPAITAEDPHVEVFDIE